MIYHTLEIRNASISIATTTLAMPIITFIGFVNRPIERYHNEVREKIKTKRGLGNDKSTQTFSDLLRIIIIL